MTRLWPEGDPVEVAVDREGLPVRFRWRGSQHDVAQIANRWRVDASWWLPGAEAAREYFKLTTADGLLCTLYRDLRADGWRLTRVYD